METQVLGIMIRVLQEHTCITQYHMDITLQMPHGTDLVHSKKILKQQVFNLYLVLKTKKDGNGQLEDKEAKASFYMLITKFI